MRKKVGVLWLQVGTPVVSATNVRNGCLSPSLSSSLSSFALSAPQVGPGTLTVVRHRSSDGPFPFSLDRFVRQPPRQRPDIPGSGVNCLTGTPVLSATNVRNGCLPSFLSSNSSSFALSAPQAGPGTLSVIRHRSSDGSLPLSLDCFVRRVPGSGLDCLRRLLDLSRGDLERVPNLLKTLPLEASLPFTDPFDKGRDTVVEPALSGGVSGVCIPEDAISSYNDFSYIGIDGRLLPLPRLKNFLILPFHIFNNRVKVTGFT